MRKALTSLAFLLATLSCAYAAQLVLPSVVITQPDAASQTPVCTKAEKLNAPAAVGTVVFSCVVPPTGWTGTVQFSGGAPFGLTPLVGNTFNVILTVAVPMATTFPAPGTLTTTP